MLCREASWCFKRNSNPRKHSPLPPGLPSGCGCAQTGELRRSRGYTHGLASLPCPEAAGGRRSDLAVLISSLGKGFTDLLFLWRLNSSRHRSVCSEQGILGRQVEPWKEGAATSHPRSDGFHTWALPPPSSGLAKCGSHRPRARPLGCAPEFMFSKKKQRAHTWTEMPPHPPTPAAFRHPTRQVVLRGPRVPPARALPALRAVLRLRSAGPAARRVGASMNNTDIALARPFPRSTVRAAAATPPPRPQRPGDDVACDGHAARMVKRVGGWGHRRSSRALCPGRPPCARETRAEGCSRGGCPGRDGAGEGAVLPGPFPGHVWMLEARRDWSSAAKLPGRWERRARAPLGLKGSVCAQEAGGHPAGLAGLAQPLLLFLHVPEAVPVAFHYPALSAQHPAVTHPPSNRPLGATPAGTQRRVTAPSPLPAPSAGGRSCAPHPPPCAES